MASSEWPLALLATLLAIRHSLLARSRPLDDRHSAQPVDQVDQSAIVDRDVVARHALAAGRHVGHEVRDLARRVRVLHVDDAQTLREPGERDLGAGHLLARLVAGGPHLVRALALDRLEEHTAEL